MAQNSEQPSSGAGSSPEREPAGREPEPGAERAAARKDGGADAMSAKPASKRRERSPGERLAGESAGEAEPAVGPAEAAPHWQPFYRSVSEAVAGMRSKNRK